MSALVLLVLLSILVFAVVLATRRATAVRGPWRLEERSAGDAVQVRAVRPGDRPLLVGAVAFGDPDFEYLLEELRSEGRQRLVALNAGVRELGG